MSLHSGRGPLLRQCIIHSSVNRPDHSENGCSKNLLRRLFSIDPFSGSEFIRPVTEGSKLVSDSVAIDLVIEPMGVDVPNFPDFIQAPALVLCHHAKCDRRLDASREASQRRVCCFREQSGACFFIDHHAKKPSANEFIYGCRGHQYGPPHGALSGLIDKFLDECLQFVSVEIVLRNWFFGHLVRLRVKFMVPSTQIVKARAGHQMRPWAA